jgi:NADH dehydrogenase (ubiquinone) 1 alpha subcomplex subunit 9
VYNLVGRNYPTKNFSFKDVHVDGAARIAAATRDAGVPRLVHVSHLNASPDSPSEFYSTKFAGEEAVVREFGRPVVLRPGPYYGSEDKFLNNITSEHLSAPSHA